MKDTSFRIWTKKEISDFCLGNGYGEPKFSGKEKTMYIPFQKSEWAQRIVIEIAKRRLQYRVIFQ